MIEGTGVDIIEVKRIKEAVEKWGDRFLNRVFTEGEIEYSRKRKFFHQHLAARFATKEAVIKAFGNNFHEPIKWRDVEISNESNGRPQIKLRGDYEHLRLTEGVNDIIVSMSHTKNYAVASAILIKNKNKF